MTDSYARIQTAEAKRLAEKTVEVIEAKRRDLDKRFADEVKTNHNWWCRRFPWLKPLTDEEAKYRVLRSGKTSCLLHWGPYIAAKQILNLVRAAGSDPFISITANDYESIRFGEDYERLAAK